MASLIVSCIQLQFAYSRSFRGQGLLIIVAVITFVLIGLLLSGLILGARSILVSQDLVALEINDEDTREVKGGNTLLNVLLDEGFQIPCPCGGKAVCFQCKVKVKEGGAIQETDKGAFSPREIQEGMRLSCQCRVTGPMKIELAASACQAKEFSVKVLSNHHVATFIKELVVEVPEDVTLEYIPGDYLQVMIPPFYTDTSSWKESMGEQYHKDWYSFGLFDKRLEFKDIEDMRAYSIASYPAEKNIVKFNIRIATPPLKKGKIAPNIDWGAGSSYLFSRKPGDMLKVSGPFGESHMRDNQKDLYFLIGGAGSSFARSHILDLFHQETKRKVHLWYGARSLKENVYEDEFKELSQKQENFSYNIVLSEPSSEDYEKGWPRDSKHCNYLFEAFRLSVLEDLESPEDALYYVCGPPMHNKSVLKCLDDYGVDSESIILDDFGS